MPPSPRRKIAFVVTEDWFFASHFLPMARAAREMGLDVIVVTSVRDHAGMIEATGARVVPLEAERRNLGPGAPASAMRERAAILKAERAGAGGRAGRSVPALLHGQIPQCHKT